jgi:N-acetylmuramoyl-L-alanine amidase
MRYLFGMRYSRAFRGGLGVLLLLAAAAWLGQGPLLGPRDAVTIGTEDIATVVSALAGAVVVVDPGHGGRDPGAVVGGALEKDIVLGVGLALGELLRQSGAAVIYTRQTDMDHSEDIPGQRKRTDLMARAKMIAEAAPDVVLSIHANAFGVKRLRGGHVFYNEKLGVNAALARHIQDELNLLYGQQKTTKVDARQYLLMQIEVPAVCVEIGFMTNPEDLRIMQDPTGQRRIAWAVCRGLAAFLRGALTPAGATAGPGPR